ncbi:type VI secretion system membrane subunit TssM [Pseudomonas sp. KCJK8670]|uniref:type VI secretion system membrane subunit TssM n=1 Tax=Pseudomonas sp. KCJK8670 TaxID=3344558 RepID=UPI003906D4EA
MKNVFKKVGAFLARTWVWSLLLVLALALLVWFVGPLLAVADDKFWEDAAARLLTISVLFLLWGLWMVYASWRANHRKQKALESEGGQERLEREERKYEAAKEIRARFKHALATLNTSSLYGGRHDRWRRDLPWYLVLGANGSGKTSLLEHSGLEFPINALERRRSQDAGNGEYCNYYFAEQGVLVDTGGRFLEQRDSELDGHAWRTLLDLLRQRRRNRPLNGVLITVPMDTLLGGDAALNDLAQKVRSRLQELRQRLHQDLPVYLVLTKTDRLAGFEEFFDQQSREENEQVFGVTFGKGKNGADTELLANEFQGLLQRLGDQVTQRIHHERNTLRRARILDFPHQLGRIGDQLCLLVDAAFTGNRYQRASHLRGVYLTSAPHHAPQVDSDNGFQPGIPGHGIPRGRARFMLQLFTRVVFPEYDLAGLDRRERRRINWGQRAVYLTALGALVLFGLLWANSFSGNHERLEALRELARQWQHQHQSLDGRDDALAALKPLDSAYQAARVFPDSGDVSLLQRAGLYQGGAANEVLQPAYQRELEQVLLPRVGKMVEEQIRSNLKNRERLLNSLRAYLMLGDPERRDQDWLQDWAAAGWSQRYSGNTAAQEALNAHFGRLLQQPFALPLNDALVAQARQVLRAESLASVVYRVLREQARSLPEYRLSQQLGPQASQFVGVDYAIPGFYTSQGYQQYFSVQGANLVNDILRDNWVLGEGPGISDMDMRRLMVALEQLYFRDYANYWGEAINQVGLIPFSDAGEGADQLSALTAANSPLLLLLTEVRENTRFPTLPETSDEGEQAAEAAAGKAAAKKLGKNGTAVAGAVAGKARDALAKRPLPDTARMALQRRFEPLHRLLDDNNGPGPDLAPTLQALNDLQQQLAGLARSNQVEEASYQMAKARMSGQRDALSSLRNGTARLPRPVAGWFNLLSDDIWRMVLNDSYNYLNQRYQSELYSFYGKAIESRYPFNAAGTGDVAISDFRDFFKAQGVADQFFDSYMKPFVSGEPGNYRLRSLDGQSLPMTKTFLEQMGIIQAVRQSFFAQNPQEPQVQFKLEPYTLDPSVSRAEFRFGDQVIDYRHGPIVSTTFKWPTEAQDGNSSLTLEQINGRPMSLEKNGGPWALFRLLDLMQTEYLKGRDTMVVKANVGGMRANYLLTSQRSPNPFDLNVLRGLRLPGEL